MKTENTNYILINTLQSSIFMIWKARRFWREKKQVNSEAFFKAVRVWFLTGCNYNPLDHLLSSFSEWSGFWTVTGGRERGCFVPLSHWVQWIEGLLNFLLKVVFLAMSLSKLQELVMDRETWHAAVHGVTRSQNWTELNWTELNSWQLIITFSI